MLYRRLSLYLAFALAALPATSSAIVVVGTGVGAIPDSPGGTAPSYGPPLVVSFAVSGFTHPVADVSATITMTHTWVGDLDVVLAAPGGSTSLPLVSRIGVTSAGSVGDSSNYSGSYVFTDAATGPNIWTVATSAGCLDACNIPPNNFRATDGGRPGQVNPPAVFSIHNSFNGLTPAQANGTWTLTFRDAALGDTGAVSAAALVINERSKPVPIDFGTDRQTDAVVTRNTGGGPGGAVTWFVRDSQFGIQYSVGWGLATDFFVPADYDGDGITDFAVWRPGSPSYFIVRRSSDGATVVQPWGQTGDNPTVVGDYDGDGKADFAVYRGGASSGQPSYWYVRRSSDGATMQVNWGISADFPAPGDYDGDGKYDFVVQRNAGGGNAVFLLLPSAGGPFQSIYWGTPSDTIVPGDYDGDGKTDIAVIRGSGGAIIWFIRKSSDGSLQQVTWGTSGSLTDFATQGDWDGDGRTDIAIWRSSATPGASAFYILKSSDGLNFSIPWGASGDNPVANFNTH